MQHFPKALLPYLIGAQFSDSSSNSGAKVFQLSTGYYLKIDQKGKLADEARLASWFAEQGLGVPVTLYLSEDKDYLLTPAAKGHPSHAYLDQPEALCQNLAAILRKLHSLTPTDLPQHRQLTDYLALAQANYQTGAFYPNALLSRFGIKTREDAYHLMTTQGHLLTSNAFIHGDYCLPNILLNDELELTALIDLGLAGWADRHIDLFWAIWSLNYNLGHDGYGDYFLDCYGRDLVDDDKLRIVAAIEAFG